MTTFTTAAFRRWMDLSAAAFAREQNALTALDTAIGDGDHGLNMQRGFSKVQEKLAATADQDLGVLCKTTGMTLLSTVGGASGPLYGTFFLKAATVLQGQQEADAATLANAIATGVAGIVARGKAAVGDKTMVDVWLPVSDDWQAATATPLAEILPYLAALATEKADATAAMIAKKGRASYLGERSVGHPDPGAVSSALLLKTLAESLA